MTDIRYIPLFSAVRPGDRIVIVGGGNIASAKAEALIECADALRIVAPQFGEPLRTLAAEHVIPLIERPFEESDLDGARLVVAATGDRAVNAAVRRAAAVRGVPVNVVDDTQACDVIFPALVKRGAVRIAVSSSGVSPVAARLVKSLIEKAVPAEFGKVSAFLTEKRNSVKTTLPDIRERRLAWERFLRGTAPADIMAGRTDRAEAALNALLEGAGAGTGAALYLIGAGPGDPELMTLKAVRLLSEADVVLYDRGVTAELLESYARRDALKIPVGKSRGDHAAKQAEINALIETHLGRGEIVARLKGGDCGIFGRLVEEAEIAGRLNVPCVIVPGITAASGCAAAAGIPLTERGGAASVRFLTLYEKDLHNDGFWVNLRSSYPETLVFYMSLQHHKALCGRLLTADYPPDTPMLAVERGTTPFHKEYAATLAEFPVLYGEHVFVSPVLFIIGNVTALSPVWERAAGTGG